MLMFMYECYFFIVQILMNVAQMLEEVPVIKSVPIQLVPSHVAANLAMPFLDIPAMVIELGVYKCL